MKNLNVSLIYKSIDIHFILIYKSIKCAVRILIGEQGVKWQNNSINNKIVHIEYQIWNELESVKYIIISF